MADSMAVKGLLHWRARQAGNIEQLRAANRLRQTKILLLQRQMEAVEGRIVEIQASIESATEVGRIAFGVKLPVTVPRKTYPKRHYTSWGGLTRSILEELKTSQDVPLTSMEICFRLNVTLALQLDPAGIQQFNRPVGYTLKRLANRGIVGHGKKPDAPERSVSWVIKVTQK